MGRYLQPGHEYADGQTITGPSLTEHVADAVLKPTTISEQLLKDSAAATDELLINDNGVFKKITLQILKTLITDTLTSADLSAEVRMPIGVIMDFAGTSEPEGWIFCYGQELARDGTYADLFGAIGTTYGEPTGSTFRVPDCRGRVCGGKDDMGGTSAGRFHPTWTGAPYNTGVNGTVLGSAGGHALHQLTVAELASHNHTFNDITLRISAPFVNGFPPTGIWNGEATSSPNSTAATGSSQHHSITQPTIIFNKIIRYL